MPNRHAKFITSEEQTARDRILMRPRKEIRRMRIGRAREAALAGE